MDYLETALEESTEETEAAEAVEETEQPEEEAPTKEQIAQEWLKEQGIDPDDFDVKKVRNLAQWEKDTNKKASELGNIAKALESQPVTTEESVELDPAEAAELKRLLKGVGIDVDDLTSTLSAAKQSVNEAREEAFVSFIESHDDVPANELIAELMESGINPEKATPAALKSALNKAYKVIQAGKVDPEAIKKQAVADYRASLSDKGVKPDEVTEVKKGRGAAAGAHRNVDDMLDDPSISMFDKLAALQDG